MKRVINKQEIYDIQEFICVSIFEFQKLNVSPSDLLICLPNWLKHFFYSWPMKYPVPLPYNYDLRIMFEIQKLFDISTQPHYKDEVVVFYQHYQLGNDKFKPRIYIIKTQEE